MKRLLLILLLVVLISCEENFDPFGDLKNKYALTCVIRGDTTFQIAALTRTYGNENYDPYSSNEDPNITGAKIRLWNGDSVVTFRDTNITRPPGSKYQMPYHLYYTKKFQLVGSQLEIEAILQKNIRLTAKTIIPNGIKILVKDDIVPPKNRTYVKYAWEQGSADNAYLTQFSIYYYKKDDPAKATKIAYIPLQYISQGESLYPISPKPSNNNQLIVDVETIRKTMELISAGDPNKSNYVILAPFLEIISFSTSLSTYFNSVARSNDAYTVNLSEIDYTNISNGVGIFGIYFKNQTSYGFTHSFIRSFGYTPGLVDVE
jgi:hypothetical protein